MNLLKTVERQCCMCPNKHQNTASRMTFGPGREPIDISGIVLNTPQLCFIQSVLDVFHIWKTINNSFAYLSRDGVRCSILHSNDIKMIHIILSSILTRAPFISISLSARFKFSIVISMNIPVLLNKIQNSKIPYLYLEKNNFSVFYLFYVNFFLFLLQTDY